MSTMTHVAVLGQQNSYLITKDIIKIWTSVNKLLFLF